ncbi:MAG: methylated-DNA--[protein]-cysteine S-methyltransferase [Planctomycetes bacterium]|nr:methylated-DNA--[protein]-cysteine S-methyltransferase [Planctomycetota bacterium]
MAIDSARGPGGTYRLACSRAGLLLAELPASGRSAARFRARVDELLSRRTFAEATGVEESEAHLARFTAWIEDWSLDVAWELFWNPPALDLRGTLFRRKVWDALRTVPPGEVLTYGELAIKSGSPRAARAVGTAMHENPAPLFVPCHRIVASGGIGGFGGAGLPLKRALLESEGVVL